LRLVLTKAADDIKVLGLDNMILFSLQEMLLLLLLYVELLLKVKGWGKSTLGDNGPIGLLDLLGSTCKESRALLQAKFLWFEGHYRALLVKRVLASSSLHVAHIVGLSERAVCTLLELRVLASLAIGCLLLLKLLLRAVNSLGHSQEDLWGDSFLGVILNSRH